MSRKDELLEEITKLDKSIEIKREEWMQRREQVEPLEENRDKIKKVYEEIKHQFEMAETDLRENSHMLHSLHREGEQEKANRARLQRELSRLLDQERINEDYQRQVEEFREKCLDAPWRAENRTDGKGAKTHQIDGAIHMAIAKQGLLGDKRGLGKTLTSLIWYDLVDALKVIVVNPSDTMDNYIREIKTWAPHRSVIKLGKMPKDQRDFVLSHIKEVGQFILVINYEAWRKDADLINDLIALKADTLVLDEAHRGKTLSTSTAKGIQKLRFGINLPCPGCGIESQLKSLEKDVAQAHCKFCGWEGNTTDVCSIKNVMPMTGTPILNKPQELFPQLRLINPENFKTENAFLSDFCMKTGANRWTWRYTGEDDVVKKIGPRYLARDRKSAGVIIPPATPITHIIPIEEMEEQHPAQYRAYRQAKEFGQILLDPDRNIAMSIPAYITVLLRLRQVLTWPAAIELKVPNEATGEMEVFAKLDVEESIKLDKAEEIIREVVEEGERVVLFSQFKAPLHELHERLSYRGDVRSCVYDGATTSYQRNRIQLDFDANTAPTKPEYDVVLGNYKAMAEGLNFTAATQMVILDEEWNPGRQEQAYGRIDRMGQTRETMIHTIRVEKTVDMWLAALIEEKRDIVGGFESAASAAQSIYDALRNGEL